MLLINKSSKYYFVFFLFYMGFQLEGRGHFRQFPKMRNNEKTSVNPTRPIFGKLWSYRLVRPSWEQSQWRYLVMNDPTYTAQVKTSEHLKIIHSVWSGEWRILGKLGYYGSPICENILILAKLNEKARLGNIWGDCLLFAIYEKFMFSPNSTHVWSVYITVQN